MFWWFLPFGNSSHDLFALITADWAARTDSTGESTESSHVSSWQCKRGDTIFIFWLSKRVVTFWSLYESLVNFIAYRQILEGKFLCLRWKQQLLNQNLRSFILICLMLKTEDTVPKIWTDLGQLLFLLLTLIRSGYADVDSSPQYLSS